MGLPYKVQDTSVSRPKLIGCLPAFIALHLDGNADLIFGLASNCDGVGETWNQVLVPCLTAIIARKLHSQ